MTDPNQPSPGDPGESDASIPQTPPDLTPAVPAPPESTPPPTGYAPPPPPAGYAPTPQPTGYAPPPPTHWEQPSGPPPGAGPAPGYVYVGFWRRVAATFIDGILFSFLYGILFAVFLSRIDASSWHVFLDIDPVTRRPLATDAEIIRATRELIGLWFGLVGLTWLAHAVYHVVLWSWRGGTLGQLALGIQVRRESDGRRIGLGTAIVRYIGYLISSWALSIGFIWVAFDRRKQGWHDKIAGTLVIRRLD